MTDRISATISGPATTFVVEGDLLSQSVAGNYSTVRCYLRANNGPGGTTGSNFGGAGVQEGHIDGVTKFGERTGEPFLSSGYADGQQRWRLGPYDVRVDHSSDGTHAPIRFAQVLRYGGVNDTRFSDYIALPTIARASKATFVGGDVFDAGAAVTINTNRASSGFTHGITYTFGTKTGVIGVHAGASVSWTPPLSLLEEFPNADSRVGTITVVTENGSSVVGTTTTSFRLRAPASVVPTVETITAADQNPDVVSLVGKFVQGLSRAKLTVEGAGVYGSTIASGTVTALGQTHPSGHVFPLTLAGTLPVSAKVTDSRTRVGSGSGTLAVLAYQPPSVSAYQARRSNASGVLQDDGAYLRVDLAATIASLLNGTQRNALTIRAFTRPRGTTAWTARNVITGALAYNSSFVVSGGAIFGITTSWEVRVEVRDKFNVYVADTTVATAGVTLDLGPNGVGVGKIHEQGALDVVGDVYAGGALLLPAATNAQVLAGTVGNRAVTPASLTALDNSRDTGWLALVGAAANSFTQSTDNPPRYRKIGRVVYLKGEFYRSTAPGASATVIARTGALPAGARPGGLVATTTLAFWGLIVQIDPNGDISIASSAARATGTGYTIAGISFIADN